MKKFSSSIARKVLKGAKDKTPVRTGKLKRKWKIDKSKVSTREVQTRVKNTSSHAHLVEDGHIKKDKNKKIIGFQQGEHMLKNSIKEVEENLEDDFNKEFF